MFTVVDGASDSDAGTAVRASTNSLAGEFVGEGVLSGADRVAGDEVGEEVALGTTAAVCGRQGAARVAATRLLLPGTLSGPGDVPVSVRATPDGSWEMVARTEPSARGALAAAVGDREELRGEANVAGRCDGEQGWAGSAGGHD